MAGYYYYKVLRKTIIQFLNLFSNVNIGRYDQTGTLLRNIKVPLVFSPRSKAYLWVRENSRNEEMLPMLSVEIQSIDFDVTRMGNKHKEITVTPSVSGGNTALYKNVIPYNITFNLRMWCLHMVDVDQIYEQILPFFSPHVFTRIYIPEVDTNIEVKVILQSCSPEMSEDASEEEARVIRWSTMFTVQTWLFKPLTQTGVIDTIFANLYSTEQSWASRTTTAPYVTAGGTYDESIDIRGLGYDEDAKILSDYEIFGVK